MVNRVYKPIGMEQGCTWSAVDRSLRTVITKVWETKKEELIEIAGYHMVDKPTVSEFIAILYNYVTRNGN